ncbi:MAG: calcium-translocating P-type ATPase, PMCA-type [Clostridia bacterium]|nr:calcium-translocating P-type ATPase, PMCA-type [Clostridia bacterium]
MIALLKEKTQMRGNITQNFDGLTKEQVSFSREKHGKNIISQKKRKSFFRQFVSNLGDPIIRVLLFALFLNILFLFRDGDIYETVGIGISVFLATFISTASEYSSESAFRRLGEENSGSNIRCKRDGKMLEISSEELVVGDIIFLGAGERIPADSVLISGKMGLDMSSMTGESREAKKEPDPRASSPSLSIDPGAKNSLPGGCTVISGEGMARVCFVGDNTLLGGIVEEIGMDTRESPLRIRLTGLAKVISRLGYIAAILVSLAYLANCFFLDSGMNRSIIMMKLFDMHYLFEKLLHALTLGLTVVVVAVPEGLPLMISVVLSANIKKMIKNNVLVRKPVGIEAAGSMNILFCDKTGTITRGIPLVGEYICGDGRHFPSLSDMKKGGEIQRALWISAFYNTSSSLTVGNDKKDSALGGNMTDKALLIDAAKIKNDFPNEDIKIIEKTPFDSDKKYSSLRTNDKKNSFLIKGAPEKLICDVENYLLDDGSERPLDKPNFLRTINEKTKEGARVLLICRGNERKLTLIAAVCLSDKMRKESPSSVKKLHEAGIHVVMVTGDNIETARSIAAECGIIGGSVDLCLTSSDLAEMGDERLSSLLPRIGVIARALPSDKSRLVRVAQEREMVVGMTGDGINDAPALRRADVGFSMGSGTQVAKDAGDIIILDNDLSSIAKAVLYGRGIFKNIRKFITLQLTMNLSAVGISMIGPFIGFDAPVTVVQMLWINIIMDTLGGIAFAGEHARDEFMREAPKRRDEPILNKYMIWHILTMGIFTILLCLSFLKAPEISRLFRSGEGNIYLLTGFFVLFIFASVFNCFSARVDTISLFSGLGKNKVFIAIMILIAFIQILFVYLGGTVLRTAPLLPMELAYSIAPALLIFPADFAEKLILRGLFSKKSGY